MDAQAPAATSDGRTILFVRNDNGRVVLLRSDADGRHAVEVATTVGVPQVIPNSTQVVALSQQGGIQSAWIVSLEGGRPVPLVNGFVSGAPTFSPDGRSMAFVTVNDRQQRVVSICDLPKCTSKREVTPPPRSGPPRWTPDGRGLAYAIRSNVWILRSLEVRCYS